MTSAPAALAIATASGDGALLPRIVLPLIFIVAIAVIGGIAILAIRRRLDGAEAPDAFTLDGLERMRAAGELTDEEFRQARNVIIEQIQRAKDAAKPDEE